MTKQELRIRYREKRMDLSEQEFGSLNGQLMGQVKQLDAERWSTVHLFLPIPGNREPDTHAVAEWLRATRPGIRLVLSISDSHDRTMSHRVWDDRTVLEHSRWGIPEPTDGEPVSAQELDVVFVPLLAFDIHGNRVGYGKGFYDRFLHECRADALKIGLSLFEATEPVADADGHDVALDLCATPSRLWHFNTGS